MLLRHNVSRVIFKPASFPMDWMVDPSVCDAGRRRLFRYGFVNEYKLLNNQADEEYGGGECASAARLARLVAGARVRGWREFKARL